MNLSYFGKQITAALQAVVLDKKGSDCGTKKTLKILFKKDLTKDLLYRYIIENGKIVLLDDNNIGKYYDKIINLRSPMCCVGNKLCRICAGQMYEKLDINNIGLTSARVASTLLNLSMKKFHDTSLKISKIDINDISL